MHFLGEPGDQAFDLLIQKLADSVLGIGPNSFHLFLGAAQEALDRSPSNKDPRPTAVAPHQRHDLVHQVIQMLRDP